MVVPVQGLDWLRADLLNGHGWEPLVAAFRREHPDVGIDLSVVSQEDLPDVLRQSSQRGLAPDLLLLRSPLALSLYRRDLLAPIPSADPSIRTVLRTVAPRMLEQVSVGGQLTALPAFIEPAVACHDRRRLPQAPASLDALLAVAAAGQPVGLAVDPVGLWWTTGPLGADRVMKRIVTGERGVAAAVDATDRARLLGWLTWLRQAALQSRVTIAAGPQDLITGLENGSLVWIPCFSLTLRRLERTMGDRLGVAPLPAGPAGAANPFIASRAWALGRNSSPEQRRLALTLMEFSLSPLIQRDLMLAGQTMLPANRFVTVPVESSQRLRAMAQALVVSRSDDPFSTALSQERLTRVVPPIERTVTEVMVGVLPPGQGADALIRLGTLP
ncbi:MAG: extracellular solute-binding protein [Cyanobacteriota bacterium]|nr:extracellular solute-binding protein [Cyanobacteriota bacterium]